MKRSRMLAISLIGLCAVVAGVSIGTDAEARDVNTWLRALRDPKRAEQAVDELAKIGEPAVRKLVDTASSSSDMSMRGWSVLAISRIPGPIADGALERLQNDGAQPALVRTWAAAGRVKRARTAKELVGLASLQGQFPALDRPLKMRFSELIGSGGGRMTVDEMLTMSMQMPQLAPMVMDPVLAAGAGPLVKTMITSADDNVRRQAAAFLGTLAQRGKQADVAREVVKAYRFRARATDVPWKGGALFLPGINWPKEEATKLVRDLVAWHVWCDVRGRNAEQTQIHNNIRSVNLARVVGYQTPGWSDVGTMRWLQVWRQLEGKEAVRAMLREQGVDKASKYVDVLR